ncbi:MAG: Holliday junction branch migration protein RuvA [Balneolaceae bacterium]|nr:Holliday junction branch migration protein RuvA [Balneolaceae bacterium]
MIAYLKGTVHLKESNRLILDVRNVGYELEISSQTLESLPEAGEVADLLVHTHVTDNDLRLFGFHTQEEKDLFELLVTVKGVGPKLGLTILSGLPADRITSAIVQQDKGTLSQISGIGKKTAERMILELKDKIAEFATDPLPDGSVAPSGGLQEEAVSALESLGFKKKDAEKAVAAAARDNGGADDVKELVKRALAQSKR